MLELHNETNWSGGLYPGWNIKREFQLTAVFKAGFQFDLNGLVTPLEETAPVIQADEHLGKPLATSLSAASEIAPFKQGSEVYLFGTAFPHSGNQNITEVGLGMAFTDGRRFKKVLRVFGRREWKRVMMNYVMSTPELLEPTPLVYENAFGGFNPEDPDDVYPQNPVGLGLNGGGWKVPNLELPRIEQAPYFTKNPSNKPPPAGFGPLPVFWQPRLVEIGDVVEDPTEFGGCPYSSSAEPSLHNAAPPDQRFPKPFAGGETIHLAGFFNELSLKQVVRLKIPRLSPQMYTIIENQAELIKPVCDTLVIDTDKRELYLVWRAGIPWRLLDRRKGWVVLKDREKREHTSKKDSKDAPGMARA